MMFEERMTRRDALKKAAYITPVILTFLAAPSFASGGSGTSERDERFEKYERYERDDEDREGGKDDKGGGKGKKGNRWLWNYERDQRHERKKLWPWD
jgi:hypothetical protein